MLSVLIPGRGVTGTKRAQTCFYRRCWVSCHQYLQPFSKKYAAVVLGAPICYKVAGGTQEKVHRRHTVMLYTAGSQTGIRMTSWRSDRNLRGIRCVSEKLFDTRVYKHLMNKGGTGDSICNSSSHLKRIYMTDYSFCSIIHLFICLFFVCRPTVRKLSCRALVVVPCSLESQFVSVLFPFMSITICF